MKPNIKTIKTMIYATIFIFVISLNIAVTPAINVNDNPKRILPSEKHYSGWDLPKKIAIFYDPNHDLLMSTAFNTWHSASIIYHRTYIIPIHSISDLKNAIMDNDYWIKLYFINGSLQGINFGSEVTTWRDIANTLSRARLAYHIFGSGSTDLLRKEVSIEQRNVRIEGSPVIGAELSYFYNLWEIGEILDNEENGIAYQECAQDFRMLGVEYFARNMDNLVNGVVDPENIPNPLGKVDEELRLRDWNAKLAQMNDAYQILPDKTIRYFNDTTTSPPNTSLRIYPAVESNDDFTITDIPLFSGLEGPAADVIDAVLSILIKMGGSKLGLDPGIAIEVVNTIKQIGLIFAEQSEGEGDVKETIKGLLEVITAIAPIPESLKPFIPVVVDGLYLLRGDANDIIDFSKSVVTAIFSVMKSLTNSSTVSAVLNIFETVFMSGPELAERLIDAENEAETTGKDYEVPNVILEFALDKVLESSLLSWLGEVYSGIFNSTEDVNKTSTSLLSFLSPLVKCFIFGDMDALLESLPNVVEFLTMKFNNNITLTAKEKSAIESIGRFYSLGMQFYDKFHELCGSLSYYTADLDSVTKIKDLIFKSTAYLGTSISENGALELAFDLVEVFNSASIQSISEQSVLKTLIETEFQSKGFTTSSAEFQTLVNALVILGSIWVPSITAPNSSDFKGILGDFIDTSTQNSTISTKKKEIITNILDTIFGFIGVTNGGTAAQLLLEDDVQGLLLNSSDSSAKISFTSRIKKSITNLLGIYLGVSPDSNLASSINIVVEFLFTIVQMLIDGQGNSVVGMLRVLATQVGTIFFEKYLGVDGTVAMRVIQNLFTALVGSNILGGDSVYNQTETIDDLKYLVVESLTNNFPGIEEWKLDLAEFGISMLFNIKGLFTDGVDFIFKEFKAALSRYIAELLGKFTKKIADKISAYSVLEVGGKIPFAGADYIGIELEFNLAINLGVEWKNEEFIDYVEEIIFKGLNDFELDVGAFFKKILNYIVFAPVFSAQLEAKSTSTGKGGLFNAILTPLGIDLEITGEILFRIQLFKFEAGGFPSEEALKLLEWKLAIYIRVSRDFTIFDVVSGGAAGGPLNKVAKYIGLDKIKITIWMSIAFEIGQKAAHNGEPAQGALTLTLGIGAYVTIGLNLAIVGIEVKFGIDINLIFFQDLTPGISAPFVITLDIKLWVNVVFTFFMMDIEIPFEWRPPGFPLDLSPSRGSKDLEENGLGLDSDNDGLSDDKENSLPSCDPNDPDTDDDGLSDKFELQVSKTDPSLPDTDGEGLSDLIEWSLKTDPLQPDSDVDGLSDFEEVILYQTDPLSRDTDQDGLTDYFEVTYSWNLTGITPSVTKVPIGNIIVNDKTDPLNPDTDNDFLLDGQEGEFGPWYGDPLNYPEGSDKPMLLFNKGYTHPLDNDTDDDSYYQYYDGSIAGTAASRVYLRDMRDGIETKGITATIIEIDPDGFMEYVSKTFQTNPCNPDSDGDTGIESREIIAGYFLNSDGYELSLNPASDPLDSDTDDDGLIDGIEGTLLPERNVTTYYANPDTDGDNLPDGIELYLGTDPSRVDTDNDLVLDGDEWFKFMTDPLNPDTDYDGVKDYWELFFSHSNPHSADSDSDGISDYEEIYIYGTDPVDEDSDNDDLSDLDELVAYGTNPMDCDSDHDGLRDGEEILTFHTNPNSKDTDSDSLLTPNAEGNPTFLLTDYDEIYVYHTNPRSMDTDNDSLIDSWELYLRYGDFSAISQANIPLDPNNNDTDFDGIPDGKELIIQSIEILVYPFTGYIVIYPFSSSPVSADTDNDKIGDKYEIDHHMRPDLSDSDNDTLSDFSEIYQHRTNPIKNDTDGDGISDANETTAYTSGIGSSSGFIPRFTTSAFDPDTDGDGWPDGLEIFASDGDARYNPNDPDVNTNGIPDGYERDFDHDLISDGAEYYIYNTYGEHGGFLDYRNPDSDFDGLMDGDEILVYGTQAFNPDTDYDTFSDSLELWIGTDPLVFTPADEFLKAVNRLTSPLQLKTPTHEGIYKAGALNIEMFNLTTLKESTVYFRYRELDNNFDVVSDWSDNFSMSYKGYSRWVHNAITFSEGTFELEVYGNATAYTIPSSPDLIIGEEQLTNSIIFYVSKTEFDWTPIIVLGGTSVMILSAIGLAAFLIRRRRLALV